MSAYEAYRIYNNKKSARHYKKNRDAILEKARLNYEFIRVDNKKNKELRNEIKDLMKMKFNNEDLEKIIDFLNAV